MKREGFIKEKEGVYNVVVDIWGYLGIDNVTPSSFKENATDK